MLRLPASKIELNVRDLTWHRERLERRRSAREEIHVSSNFAAQQVDRFLHQVPQPAGFDRRWSNDSSDALVSRQPVPVGLPQFWEKILAEAGVTPICAPEEDEDEENAGHTHQPRPHDQVDLERASGKSADDSGEEPHGQYHSDENENENLKMADLAGSIMSTESSTAVVERLTTPQTKDGSESMRAKISRHRRSIFSFRSRKRDHSTREASSEHLRNISSHRESVYDGISDTNAEDDLDELTAKPMPRIDAAANAAADAKAPRQARGTASSGSEGQAINELTAAADRLSISSRPGSTPVHSSEHSFLSTMDRIRSRSGTVSRSPLHIFHRAISSSPDKFQASAHSHVSSSSPSPFLSRPPRHPLQRAASPPQERRINHQQTTTPTQSNRRRHYSPPALVPPGSPSQSLSPFSLPHSTPRSDPPLPLLPPPFSTTPRRASATLPSVPFASPTPSPHPSPFHNLTHFRLFTPPSATREGFAEGTTAMVATALAVAVPRTPRGAIRVYDDGAPVGTQPRTPAGLPRHGVIGDGGLAGARTAPPAQGTSWTRSWGRRVRRRDRGSPESFSRRARWDEEQENL